MSKKFVLIGIALFVAGVGYFVWHSGDVKQAGESTAVSAGAREIQRERDRLDETVWSREVLAQEYEQTIVHYWDQMLRPESDKFPVLASMPFETIRLGEPVTSEELDWGITRTEFGGEWKTFDHAEWGAFLEGMKAEGYHVYEIEFHQTTFEVDESGQATSVFAILLHVTKANSNRRWVVKGSLNIAWSDETDANGLHIPRSIDATDVRIFEREVSSAFKDPVAIETTQNIGIVLAYDLNRDGLSDIALPIQNKVLWNRGNGQFEAEALVKPNGLKPPRENQAAVIADFTGDGYADLLCTGMYASSPSATVVLFRGDSQGRFGGGGEIAVDFAPDLRKPMCMTAGDIDGDGDLDVWLGQYKPPYQGGQMPTPFYDANDGYPAYLLVNQGDGRFEDGTEAAGLAAKRNRRTYSASFVDLDLDNDLDLLVVNDFAGVDIYYNDGSGFFTDVTQDAVDESANFGMAHTFGDYNADGQLDFFVTGMASTTMRRLNSMGLQREDFPEYTEMRTRMGYGNRMYMGGVGSGYRQPSFGDSVARSGWSWGVTSLDFDNDGDLDLYIANGHLSDKTTKDYCTRFWCHDIYTQSSTENFALNDFFLNRAQGNFSDMSWDGYQKNHLFMNQEGVDFVNVAFLMNAALGFDARCVLTDDLNVDGKADLLVTSAYNPSNRVQLRNSLYFLENNLESGHNWIGVRLQEEPGGPSPIGARISVEYESGKAIARIVTGDSFRSQHANVKHFGLGKASRVQSIQVTWPDGRSARVEDPSINEYHLVRAGVAR